MQAKSIVVLTYPEPKDYANNQNNNTHYTGQDFKKDPDQVNAFYNQLRQNTLEQQPSSTHTALASLEHYANDSGSSLTIITSSTNDLHKRAGNHTILHTHGELMKARCTRTLNIVEWPFDITPTTPCPCCNTCGTLRPHIVLPDEIPFCLFDTEDALLACDLLIAIKPHHQHDKSLDTVMKVSGHKILIANHMIDGFDLHIKDTNEQTISQLLNNLINQAA